MACKRSGCQGYSVQPSLARPAVDVYTHCSDVTDIRDDVDDGDGGGGGDVRCSHPFSLVMLSCASVSGCGRWLFRSQ